MQAIIQLKDIVKTYRTATLETTALDGVSLDVNEGEFLSIMGPSGCGKSTLLNIIGLLDRPDSGSVIIEGRDTAGLGDRELARLRNSTLGFIFQSFHLIPTLNVLDNVMMPLAYRKGYKGNAKAEAKEALAKVGLPHRMEHYPAQLSGGQAQRVAIARAIIGKPRIILADEPCGNLDSHMSAEIMDILRRLNKEDGTTIVMVTHSAEQAALTDRTVHFFDGRQVAG